MQKLIRALLGFDVDNVDNNIRPMQLKVINIY